MEIDPYANDPGRWGASLVTLREVILPCLDAAGARSVVEVGAYAGDLTAVLADWAGRHGGWVWAIDPSPQDGLVRLADERPEVELIRATSHEAIPRLPAPDAAIIDGDHNYYTVSRELELIAEGARGGRLPLLMLHDVGWPHGRRDDYYAPELIPEEHRQPIVEGAGLFPGVPGVRPGGLPYHWAAEREGGPRNGVLTAVEDFLAERDGVRLAIVPAFFALGVVWERGAEWSDAVAAVVEKWDRDPVLERLEANRVHHLASTHFQMVRVASQEAVLRRLLESSAFSVAERLSRLRRRLGIAPGESVISKDEVRRVLGR